jgi:hypothetical protein
MGRLRAAAAGVALLFAVFSVSVAAPVAAPNLVACGSTASGCSPDLPVQVNQPFESTDPYYASNCVEPGFTCLPVQFPVGDWVTSVVRWRALW